MSDDRRSAVTVIGFVGSVFSPYYAWARRRGPADPENHVALNVALYDRHPGWAMTERGRRSLDRGPQHLTVGPSGFRVSGRRLTIRFEEIRVPFPQRLRGEITVEMPQTLDTFYPLDASGRHLWRPIAPTARMTVDLDGPRRSWSGDAYVDHNVGTEPLETAFRSWSWSRVSHEAGTSIVYALEPGAVSSRPDESVRSESALEPRQSRSRAFRVDIRRGESPTLGPVPPPVPARRTGWAIERVLRSDTPERARVLRTLEDTPFYARSLVELEIDGRLATGIHESLSLDRFRNPIVQAMLPFRMPRRA